MFKRAATAVIGSVLLLASNWALAPAMPDPTFVPASPADVQDAAQAAGALAPDSARADAQAARLASRLAIPPPSTRPARNPFEWGHRDVSRRAPVPPPPATSADAPPPAAPIPVLVALLATDGSRSAVLSWDDALTTVRVGDRIGPFVVRAIDADRLTLADAATLAHTTTLVVR